MTYNELSIFQLLFKRQSVSGNAFVIGGRDIYQDKKATYK